MLDNDVKEKLNARKPIYKFIKTFLTVYSYQIN